MTLQRRPHCALAIAAALAVCMLARPDAQAARPVSGVERTSVYIPMRDGVRLAATVYTPKGLAPGARTPTVLHQTRYYRLMSVKPAWRWLTGFKPVAVTEVHTRERLLEAGYSWVDVDVRGSGASFGRWVAPYDPDTIADGAEVLDWIAAQPWSSGRVAAIGTSYAAALAVMQLSHGHPALRAVVSTFGIWDLAALWPGGLQDTQLVPSLALTFAELDRGDFSNLGWRARFFAQGVEPVDRALLAEAERERATNTNLGEFFAGVEFLDDPIRVTRFARTAHLDAINPRAVVGRQSAVPVLTFAGWYDNAFAEGALQQFVDTRAPGSRVRVGPWIHGIGASMANRSPYARDKAPRWEGHAEEVQRFLDRHLRGIETGIDGTPPVQYYIVGEERWRGAETWPPPDGSERILYLGPSATLSPIAPPAGEAFDRYDEDFTTTSGGARWGLTMRSTRDRRFGDRRPFSGRLLHYTSAPLAAPATIVGAPQIELFLDSSVPDGGIFVYLEDVAPDGFVRYVTEGQLRLVSRRSRSRSGARPMPQDRTEPVVLGLLPIAYRIPAGHSIRVSIAGADASSFRPPQLAPVVTYNIHRDAAHPSRITLPIPGS